jgi:type I restriction enzyme M protein
MSDYDERLSRIHDFLYANGASRTGASIAKEFSNIVSALKWASQNDGDSRLDPFKTRLIMEADPESCKEVADKTRRYLRQARSADKSLDPKATLESADICIARVVAELEGVDLLDKRRDWIGDAVEKFRSIEAKRLGGQFFTDQRVTELAMDLLEVTQTTKELVDICAGTGGFLLAAARRIRSRSADTTRLVGLEVDDELVRAGKRSLAGSSVAARIERADSLRHQSEWSTSAASLVRENAHALLASNPPFGSKIKIADKTILARFDLARKWTKRRDGTWTISSSVKPTPPDILFVERNIQLAKPGGRVALVLPYQILSGPQLEYVREWIFRKTKVIAVIDCPSETFQPWTGTKTSLVLLEKRSRPLETSQESESQSIFMAVGKKIGHDRRGKPVLNSEGLIDTDFPSIGAAFSKFVAGQSKLNEVHKDSFVVTTNDVLSHPELRLNAVSFSKESTDAADRVRALATRRGWRESTIGREVESVFFPGRFKRAYVDSNHQNAVPFLGGSQLLSIEATDGKFIDKTDSNFQTCLVERDWILVTRSGSTGIVSSVPENWHGFAMSEHVIRIIPRPNGLPGGYIEAFLASDLGQTLISAGVFGSVIDEITPEHLESIPIPVPVSESARKQVLSIDKAARESRTRRAQAARAIEHARELLRNSQK